MRFVDAPQTHKATQTHDEENFDARFCGVSCVFRGTINAQSHTDTGRRVLCCSFGRSAMAPAQKQRPCEGPKLCDHPLCGALREKEGCSKFLDDYGANPALACSQQKPVNNMLTGSWVRLQIPKAQSDGQHGSTIRQDATMLFSISL